MTHEYHPVSKKTENLLRSFSKQVTIDYKTRTANIFYDTEEEAAEIVKQIDKYNHIVIPEFSSDFFAEEKNIIVNYVDVP